MPRFKSKRVIVILTLIILQAMAAASWAIADLIEREARGLPVEVDANVVHVGDGGSMTNTTPGREVTGGWPSGNGVAVYVNGNYITFPDQQPFVNADGRTMVPVRFVAQELGAKVDWDATARKVTITRQDTEIALWIGQTTYIVNGQAKVMDTKPVLVNGRTMVPLRFISEALGATVKWVPETRTVEVVLAE